MIRILLVSFTYMYSAIAAPQGGEHGHVSDLIAPLVNVLILASFLLWKLKKPLSNYFVKKSTDISDVMSRASIKAKEAEMLLKTQQSKLEKLDEEVKKIKTDARSEVETFELDYKKSIESKIKRLREDAGQKINSEKNEMMDVVNSMLLNEVIARTKSAVKNDKNLAEKISVNLIQG